MKTAISTILCSYFALFSLSVNGQNRVEALEQRDPVGNAECFADFTTDGSWCWFSDPRAVYYEGTSKRTYAGWVNSRGDIVVGTYDHVSGKIDTAVLHQELEVDDHANPSILVRQDGKLMVFYSKHSRKDVPMSVRVSVHPEDITEWQMERPLTLNDPKAYPAHYRDSYCYTNPCQLSQEKGRIFLFWRGMGHKPNLSTSQDGGKTWTPGQILVHPEEIYRNRRPYLKVESNGRDRIHLAFTDGHPRREPTNSIYYALYRNGGFYKADSTKFSDLQSLPLMPRRTDVVYDARSTGVRAWVWDVAQDAAGNPVIVYARLPAETDHRYHYARWDGKRWNDHEITEAGKWFPDTPEGEIEREPHYSGGLVLDHENPSIVYLSRQKNGVFEIEKWTTDDLGSTWISAPLTSRSKRDNVRPFVVRNSSPGAGPHVLWMTCARYVHYTEYLASIKMDFPSIDASSAPIDSESEESR